MPIGNKRQPPHGLSDLIMTKVPQNQQIQIVTTGSILKDLRALGVAPGDIICAHTSMKALGLVIGGPRTVVEALQAAVSPGGTVMMPAFSGDLSDPAEWQHPPVPTDQFLNIRKQIPAYDRARTPTRGLGQVAEYFRTYPGVRRSPHPQSSFCAWGPHAEALIANQSYDNRFGPQSPLGRLMDAGGKVILLGAPHDTVSLFHLTQHLVGANRSVDKSAPITERGARRWQRYKDIEYPIDWFADGVASLIATSIATTGQVGAAVAVLFPATQAVNDLVEKRRRGDFSSFRAKAKPLFDTQMAMPAPRIIARLDIKGANVIKGIHLEGLRIVGQPGPMARRYYENGVDEIVYMDTVASLYQRNNILPVVEDAARDIFVPLTVGGGIRTIEDIVAALRAGADKVAINTAAIAHPEFIREAAETFGSQCIVVSVEAKRRGEGRWEALTDNGRERTGVDVLKWAREAERLGAGELLITSVDAEGTRRGFDHALFRAVRQQVSIPAIGCGGAGKAEDVIDAVRLDGLDAVACASLFHYDHCAPPALKGAMLKAGLTIRPEVAA